MSGIAADAMRRALHTFVLKPHILVGKQPIHILQTKFRTFRGTLSFQTKCQANYQGSEGEKN